MLLRAGRSAATRAVVGVRGRLTRLAADEGHWRTVTLAVTLLLAAAGLWQLVAQAAQVGLQRHLALVVGVAVTYTVLGLLVVARRRVSRRLGWLVMTALLVIMLLEGTLYPDASLRWVCLAFLVVLPLLAVVILGSLGTGVVTAASLVVAVVIALGLPGTPEIRSYVASTMATLVLVPVLLVGVLVRQLEHTRALARRLASTDALTGLLNRRGVAEGMPPLVAAARARGDRLALVLADVDHFKSVNDTYGHVAGDRVLVSVAAALRGAARAGDLVVRLGGEEVAWLAPCAGTDDALAAAERARAAVAAARFPDVPGLAGVTASLGVAVVDPARCESLDALLDDLLAQADAALYAAKAAGRNCVVPAGDTPASSAASAATRPAAAQTERARSGATPV